MVALSPTNDITVRTETYNKTYRSGVKRRHRKRKNARVTKFVTTDLGEGVPNLCMVYLYLLFY